VEKSCTLFLKEKFKNTRLFFAKNLRTN